MSQQKEGQKLSLPRVVGWLSPFSIAKNIPLLIVLFVLCVVYISNANKAIAIVKEQNKRLLELKEVRWKNRDLQSRLMNLTTEKRIIEKSQQAGLKPLEKPAFEIVK